MSDECPHGLIASPAPASQIPQPSGGGGGGGEGVEEGWMEGWMQEHSGCSSGPDMAGWVKVTRSVGGTCAI